ncbi:MAG: glycosyltransferase family 2 protein [Desulfovibrio sp.]
MHRLTYIVTAFDRDGRWLALNESLENYEKYDPALLDHIRFVIVDDCCPEPVRLDKEYDLNLTILRVDTDIPWNQGGARNLGVDYARTDRVLLTDMDFFFPEKTLQGAMTGPLAENELRRFRRTTKISGTGSSPHNIFLMHKKRFMQVGGVDEIFAGHYGFEDVFFVQQQKEQKAKFTCSDDCCLFLLYKDEKESSDPSVGRDFSHNRALMEGKTTHSGTFLNFEWSVVLDKTRSTAAKGV